MADSKLLTVGQASEKLSVPEKTVRDWLRSGKLKGLKVGKLWRIPEVEILNKYYTVINPVKGMETISFVSIKGGTGKSSSSIVTAFLLSETDRVLMVDLDPQNALTSHFIKDIATVQDRTVRQVLKEEAEIQNCIVKINNNLDLLPAEIELGIIERELAGISNQIFLLYDALEAVKHTYKYCIIDTPPTMSLITKIGVVASNTIIIPTQLEAWGIRGLSATLNEIEDCKRVQKYINQRISKIMVLPTFFESNRTVKETYLEALKKEYQDYLSRSLIHSASEISKTFSMPGETLSKNTRAYGEYQDFVEELRGN